MIRENLKLLQLPQEVYEVVWNLTESLMGNVCHSLEDQTSIIPPFAAAIESWHLWGRKDKRSKKSTHSRHSHNTSHQPVLDINASIQTSEKELPGNVYAGGAEILAGSLLLILALIFPPAGWIGWGLIGDGARRVYDGVVEFGEERRNDPNFVPPQGPFGVNF